MNADINLTMNDWKIPTSPPYIFLGESGENQAITLSIKLDEVVQADDVKYFLDIMDRVDGENPKATSQEMEIVIEQEEIDGVINDVYYIQMKPLAQWLGKENVKILQVRCEYTDITIDENDEEVKTSITIKSNTFYGYVGKGIYIS